MKILILMSTYNGEKYIKEQLDSIFFNTTLKPDLLIRDDGSRDTTTEIIEDYKKKNPQFKIYLKKDKNIGFAKSFMQLISLAEDQYDFFFFADQDDYWERGKLENATNILKSNKEIPSLYFSKTEYVDSKLNHLGFSPNHPRHLIGFRNAIVQNIATGCTIALNKKSIQLLKSSMPESLIAHDWWCYLVISAFGEIFYDENSYIKYRQHQNNTIGFNTSIIKRNFKRFNRFFKKNRFPISKQLEMFSICFGSQLEKEKSEILKAITGKNRFYKIYRILIKNSPTRSSKFDNLLLSITILLNKF